MSEQNPEGTGVDERFFHRADEYINVANEQIKIVPRSQVSASMLFGTARFNAWLSATQFESAEAFEKAKDQVLDYFTNEYRQMLEENLKDYIKHYDQYIQPNSPE